MRVVVAVLNVPVTAKIRIFPELDRTLAYARMLQAAGVYVLGVHGRTREQKDNTATRAYWDAIKVGFRSCSSSLGSADTRAAGCVL